MRISEFKREYLRKFSTQSSNTSSVTTPTQPTFESEFVQGPPTLSKHNALDQELQVPFLFGSDEFTKIYRVAHFDDAV